MFRTLFSALALAPSAAFAGSFLESELPLSMSFSYDWTGVVHGHTTYTFDDDGSVWSPSSSPFAAENRMACGNYDFCVNDGSFTTGNGGEGSFLTRARRIQSSCVVDNAASPPTGDFWYWFAFFAPGLSLEPTRCTVRQFIRFEYDGTGAVYEGTAQMGSIVFWRAYNNGGNVVGTVPTLTDPVYTGGTYSGDLSGPGTGTFAEL